MKAALILMFFCAAVQAEGLYKWVDADGSIHYTDHPPPPSAKTMQRKNLGGNYIETSQLPYALQQAVKNFPVTLYISDCGEPCTKAHELLTKRGIPFSEKNARSPEEGEKLKKLIGEASVPVLLIGSTAPHKGFSESAWNSALTEAGYPLTAVRPTIKKEKSPEVKLEAKTRENSPTTPVGKQ